MKVTIKAALFCTAIFIYILTTLPFLLTVYIFPNWTRKILTQIVSFYCSVCLKALQVRVVLKGKLPEHKDGLYVVSNHMGFVDIMAISKLIPVAFVTSREMQYTPLLGQVCALGGSVFVNRKNKNNMHNEIKMISKVLETKTNIMVFPEAKSTNGDNVVLFRRGLFSAPVRVNAKILPLTVNYISFSGEPVSKKNRDTVFWYDDLNFFAVFFKKCAHSEITIEITIHPLIQNFSQDITEVANECHRIVSSAYRGVAE
jgi:1-acyl-sn-glycerol-3-phosphate acyltransferase